MYASPTNTKPLTKFSVRSLCLSYLAHLIYSEARAVVSLAEHMALLPEFIDGIECVRAAFDVVRIYTVRTVTAVH